jgi:hypothetical protein
MFAGVLFTKRGIFDRILFLKKINKWQKLSTKTKCWLESLRRIF